MEQPQSHKLRVQLRYKNENGNQLWADVYGGRMIFGRNLAEMEKTAIKKGIPSIRHPYTRLALFIIGSIGEQGLVSEYDMGTGEFTTERFPNAKYETKTYIKPVSALNDMALRASINGRMTTLYVTLKGDILNERIHHSVVRYKRATVENPNCIIDKCFIYWTGDGLHKEKLVATYDKLSESFIVEEQYLWMQEIPYIPSHKR